MFRLCALISVAMWKRSLRIEPTTRNSGVTCQQVFSWQLPDVPWHLHFLLMWSSTTCEKTRDGYRPKRKSGMKRGKESKEEEEGEKMRRINNFLDHWLHLKFNIYKHRVLPGASHVSYSENRLFFS